METEGVKERVKQLAENGGMSCHDARALAEELSVEYVVVGRACNDLEIKIFSCELGCF